VNLRRRAPQRLRLPATTLPLGAPGVDHSGALRAAAARSGRSVAELIREAVRKTVLKPRSAGPVALWDGEPKRTSIEHDSVHDEP